MSKLQVFLSGFRAMGGYPKWNKTKSLDLNANCLGYENRQSGIGLASGWIEETMQRPDDSGKATILRYQRPPDHGLQPIMYRTDGNGKATMSRDQQPPDHGLQPIMYRTDGNGKATMSRDQHPPDHGLQSTMYRTDGCGKTTMSRVQQPSDHGLQLAMCGTYGSGETTTARFQQPPGHSHPPEFGQSLQPSSANTHSFVSELLGPFSHDQQTFSAGCHSGGERQEGDTVHWGQSLLPSLPSRPDQQQFSNKSTAGTLDRGQFTSEAFERMDDVTTAIGGFLIDQPKHSRTGGDRGLFSYGSLPPCSYGNMGVSGDSMAYPENVTKQLTEINNSSDYLPSHIDPHFDKKTSPAFTQSPGNSQHYYSEQTTFSTTTNDMAVLAQRSSLTGFEQRYERQDIVDTSNMWQPAKGTHLSTSCPPKAAGKVTGSEDTQKMLSQGGSGLTAEPVTDSSNCEDLSDIEQLYNILMSPEHSFDDREDDTGGDEETRLHRRREKNRVAAQKCRQKKRDASNNLVKEYQDLESSNTQLRFEIRQYQKQKQDLEKLLSSHLTDCTKHSGSSASSSTTSIPSTCSMTTCPNHTVSVPPQADLGLPSLQVPGSRNSSSVTHRDHRSIQSIQADTEADESGGLRSSTKRGSSEIEVKQTEEGKKFRLPQPAAQGSSMSSSMAIPTPIWSQKSESSRLTSEPPTPWKDSGQPFGHKGVHQGRKPQLAIGKGGTALGTGKVPSFGLGSDSRGWSVDENVQVATQGRFDHSSVYKTTSSSQDLPRQATATTATKDSFQQTPISQLSTSSIVRLSNPPSQISPSSSSSASGSRRSDHMTQRQQAESNISVNQRPSNVANQVQLNRSGSPLVLQPPHCIQSMDFSAFSSTPSGPSGKPSPTAAYINRPARPSDKHTLTTSTLPLTSATVSASSPSSLPPLHSEPHHSPVNRGAPRRSKSRTVKAIDFNSMFNITD